MWYYVNTELNDKGKPVFKKETIGEDDFFTVYDENGHQEHVTEGWLYGHTERIDNAEFKNGRVIPCEPKTSIFRQENDEKKYVLQVRSADDELWYQRVAPLCIVKPRAGAIMSLPTFAVGGYKLTIEPTEDENLENIGTLKFLQGK